MFLRGLAQKRGLKLDLKTLHGLSKYYGARFSFDDKAACKKWMESLKTDKKAVRPQVPEYVPILEVKPDKLLELFAPEMVVEIAALLLEFLRKIEEMFLIGSKSLFPFCKEKRRIHGFE